MEMLKQKTIRSAGWVGIASILTYGINAITKIILARLLFPEDFGLFAMAFLFISLLTMFIGFGIGDALIISKEDFNKNVTVAFFLTTVIGTGLFFLSFSVAPLIALFFKNNMLTLIIRLLSVVFIFDSIVVIFRSFLIRELHFFRKSLIEISGAVVYGTAVIILAYKGYGVWSIIWAYILQHFLLLILFLSLSPWKPVFSFSLITRKDIASSLHQGTQFFSGTFLAWTITTVDNIIIGRRLGEGSLGYYSFGYNVSNMPVTGFTHIFTGIFQSVYAKLSAEKNRLRKAYLLSLRWTLLFVLPAAGGLFILSDFFIYVIIGDKWLPMLPVLMILALYSPIRSLSSIQAHLIEAVGFPKKEAFLLLIELVILLVLFYPMITFYGIVGGAISVFVARTSMVVFRTMLTQKFTDVSWQETFVACKAQIIGTVFMMGVLFVTKFFFLDEYTITHFFILVLLGIVCYGMTIFIIGKDFISEAKEIFYSYN